MKAGRTVKVPKGLTGLALLRNPLFNKGTAFTEEERKIFELDGLLPHAVETIEQQAKREKAIIDTIKTPLDKFMYLQELQDRNERLFYRTVCDSVKELAPFVYTPTVGQACTQWSGIFRRSRGLYISLKDAGNVKKILSRVEQDVKAIVVTDGERILGLGDLGSNGMGIPIGKLALYSACAGVPPENTLPVQIDAGTNNQTLLDDPNYIGLRQKREYGPSYFALVGEFITECQKKWGRTVFIQFEDFGNANAFKLLNEWVPKCTTFNDDIQGTGAVILAGLLNCCKVTEKPFPENKFLFLGAGEAGIGISNTICEYLVKVHNMKPEDAHKTCWLFDINGLVCKSRKDLEEHQLPYAHDHPAMARGEFVAAIEELKPTAIIGVSACGKAFTEEVVKTMTKINKTPIIFALSNPTSKAECTAEQAYTWSEGKCIFAAGSPFEPVTINGVKYCPGQGNNMFIFPAVGIALIATKAMKVSSTMLLASATALRDSVTPEELKQGLVFPDQSRIREVTFNVAMAVMEKCFEENQAGIKKPADLKKLLEDARFALTYDTYVKS